MRRKAGIVLGGCAALVLIGSAGAAVLTYTGDEGRPVGTWHEGTPAARTPVASVKKTPGTAAPAPGSSTGATAPGLATPEAAGPIAAATRTAPTRKVLPESARISESAGISESARISESASVTADGRQKVGQLVRVGRLLGYQGGAPQIEKFSYPGASYVKLHFNRMAMLPGDYLTVSNPDHTESYRYDAPRLLKNGSASADKWAMSVTGDTATLEMHRAAGDTLGANKLLGSMGVNVDRVARGFTRSQQQAQPDEQPRTPGHSSKEESVCGTDTAKDAACYRSADPVAYTKSKAIARLLINGTELCTGWRVGPNNRMLTNNHCFTTSDEAYNTEVWFNYQCVQCGGYDVIKPAKVWGAKVLATDHIYDYTLFSVGDFTAVRKFGYLTLDTARPVKGQELYVPQHPAGEPAKIAGSLGEKVGNCSVADPGYTGYATRSDVAYYCDTEGGSSGSPVISRATNKVVALHHFGGCPNSGVRADLLAIKLRTLL